MQLNDVKTHESIPALLFGCYRHHIIMHQDIANEINKALKENDEKTLNKWRAVLQHEKEHINKEDLIVRTAVDLAIPFVTHGSLKILRNILPFVKKVQPFWKEQILKMPTGLGKSIINDTGRAAIYRYQEKRADNGVKNDSITLNGLKNALEEIQQEEVPAIKSLSQKFNIPEQNMEKILENITNIIGTHPPLKKRIARLDERIAKLKE